MSGRNGGDASEICKASPLATPLTREQKQARQHCSTRKPVRKIPGRRTPVDGYCTTPAQWTVAGRLVCTRHAAAILQGS